MPTKAQIERDVTALTNRIDRRKERLAKNEPLLKEKREKYAKALNGLATKVREDQEGLKTDQETLKWYETAPVTEETTAAEGDPFEPETAAPTTSDDATSEPDAVRTAVRA